MTPTESTNMPHPPDLSPVMRKHHPRHEQRGVALFIVIVFVMLSMLLALWASRTALFNELVVGNDADYQRAYEAAQALLQDAELDIRSELANGTACTGQPCRPYRGDKQQFPSDAKEINPVITTLEGLSTRCKDAICARRVGRQDFWNYTDDHPDITADTSLGEVPLEDLMTVGARYGDYTGAQNVSLNPILADHTTGEGGWYWIEVIPYSDIAKSANLIVGTSTSELALNLEVYVVYRITAYAKGRKPGTEVVVQETYARQRLKD